MSEKSKRLLLRPKVPKEFQTERTREGYNSFLLENPISFAVSLGSPLVKNMVKILKTEIKLPQQKVILEKTSPEENLSLQKESKTLLVVRSKINPHKYDENGYKDYPSNLSTEEWYYQTKFRVFDQIAVLHEDGNITDRKDLKYAEFNTESNKEDQIRHETIHPIAFHLAKQIFGIQIENLFSVQVEVIAGGFDWFLHNFLDDKGRFQTFSCKEEKSTFRVLLFQLAVAWAINTSFYQSPESSEKCIQNKLEFYQAFNKLIQKINKTIEENSQNDKPNQDIILDYTECLNLMPQITKKQVIYQIDILIEQILNSKHIPFASLNFTFDNFENWLQELNGEKLFELINNDKF